MQFAQIKQKLKGIPFISEDNAQLLYDLIIKEKLTNILELGIAHGTATCYMAAALDELGQGEITAVDLLEAKEKFCPSAEEQLIKTNLQNYARVIREQTGYTWFLHNEIRQCTTNNVCQPKYDLCIIDGPKNWTIDGCAFFLADKLLKEGGWIIFDDYKWTYANADRKRATTDGITHRQLSEEEFKTPQIKEVFELLVMQHPSYSDFVVQNSGDWAWARKSASTDKTFTLQYRETYRDSITSIKHRVKKLLKHS